MSRLPSMPMWWADFFIKTDHLSNDEQWAYCKLLAKTWCRNCQPLPDSPKDLARLLGLSLKQWLRIRERIAPFFDLSEGVWRQKHLEEEFQKGMGQSQSSRTNGALGGRPKSRKTKELENPDVTFGLSPREGARAGVLKLSLDLTEVDLGRKEEKEKTNLSVGKKEILGEPQPVEAAGQTEAPAEAGPPLRVRRKHQIPDDWAPSEVGRNYATSEAGWSKNRIEQEVSQFRDHHRGKGNTFLDDAAAWRTWVRNGAKFQQTSGRGNGGILPNEGVF